MAERCPHHRRFQVSFLGKRRGGETRPGPRSGGGIWCADCGQRLSGQGRLSPRKLKAFADMQRPAEPPPSEFDLE